MLFVSLVVNAQHTNEAIASGYWNGYNTWYGNLFYNNAATDVTVIDNGVTVVQNIPTVYTKEITFYGNGEIILRGNNEIKFLGSAANVTGSNIIDDVAVDFSNAITTKTLSGFLQGLTNYPTFPTVAVTAPLKPGLMRQWDTIKYHASNAINDGVKVHMCAGDHYQRSSHNYIAPALTPPSAYLDNLDLLLDWGYNNGLPRPNIVWECWNEPNFYKFWTPGDVEVTKTENRHLSLENDVSYWAPKKKEEFFETYKVFYHRVYDKLGASAKVAGPSIGTFNAQYLKEFFDYCLLNDLEVNVVTWHEIDYAFGDHLGDRTKIPYIPISSIKGHVDYIRTNFMNNPAYSKLKIETIEINEIVNYRYRTNPAAGASYLDALERAGVASAAKACWEEPGTPAHCCNACDSDTFNHLFVHNTHEPTAAYWLYKYYADGVAGRVSTVKANEDSAVLSSKNVPAFAASANHPQISVGQVLFGYYSFGEENTPAPAAGVFDFTLNNISAIVGSSTTCYITIKKIANTNAESASLPVTDAVYSNYPVSIVYGTVFLQLPVEKDALYQLIISQVPIQL